jgi:hypothetical protein
MLLVYEVEDHAAEEESTVEGAMKDTKILNLFI